jgi:redox-regulated HSP33 family molecular chaperone
VEPLLDCSREAFLRDIRRRIADGQWKPIGEFLVFYECRCDHAMIDRMLDTLTPEQQENLWAGSDTLTIECPRCGRSYTLRRTSGS